jgi:thiamine pyrophosphokinase
VRALVVGAAWAPGADAFYADLAADHDLVVAADAAAERLARAGATVDIAVGDFDSADPGAVDRLTSAGIDVRVFPAAKDVTDLELAVEAARTCGASTLTITGAFRARLDHTLAALGTLARCADLEATAVEPDLRLWVVDGREMPAVPLALPTGTTVSLLAIGGAASGVSLLGFRYPLRDARLEAVSGLGVSNVAEGDVQAVMVAEGTVLVVVAC